MLGLLSYPLKKAARRAREKRDRAYRRALIRMMYNTMCPIVGDEEEHQRVAMIEDSLQYSKQPEHERIWRVAIRGLDGRIWSLKAPSHHDNIILLMAYCGAIDVQCDRQFDDQGFVTSNGRYVGREEARRVAIYADQLPKQSIHERELFSEDLWSISNHPPFVEVYNHFYGKKFWFDKVLDK